MTYEKVIKYLYNSVPIFQNVGAVAYKEGLYNTKKLDEHFNHPHKKYRTVHVAGTNGKGSCSHTIAAILQDAGYKVGLYTSPHLKDFRERIRVNGECISKDYVVDFVEKERGFFEPLHPSFFELTTALAFKYFADANIDIAVVEVGLGGRLDCTNIITPIVSVITNISFDHTQFLGKTLDKIAGEKAGIIKEGIPVVVGEILPETRPVFVKNAEQCHSKIIIAEESREVIDSKQEDDGSITYTTRHFGVLNSEMGGIYQIKNTNTVLCAIREIKLTGLNISDENVRRGVGNVIEKTHLLGRWQTMGKNPTVICDTGHNMGGWQYLSKQLAAQKCKQMRVVFGMVDDKDIEGVMSILPKSAIYYFAKAKTKRAINENILIEESKKFGLHGTCYNNVKTAFNSAMADADKDDFIFVGGSSYIVADFMTDCL